jgi:hypothetical protein
MIPATCDSLATAVFGLVGLFSRDLLEDWHGNAAEVRGAAVGGMGRRDTMIAGGRTCVGF